MRTLAIAAILTLVPALPLRARAQEDDEPYVAAPSEQPLPPSAELPAPPDAERAGPPAAATGQWIHTQQYGWVWSPYGDAYSYVPPDGEGEPYEYVWCPDLGWAWLAAPWIWGIGPWPWFGAYGPVHFGWYEHGWWRTPDRWHYRPSGYHGYGGYWHGGYGSGKLGGASGYRTFPGAPRGGPGGRGGWERPGGRAFPGGGSSAGGRSLGGGRGFSTGRAFTGGHAFAGGHAFGAGRTFAGGRSGGGFRLGGGGHGGGLHLGRGR